MMLYPSPKRQLALIPVLLGRMEGLLQGFLPGSVTVVGLSSSVPRFFI